MCSMVLCFKGEGKVLHLVEKALVTSARTLLFVVISYLVQT